MLCNPTLFQQYDQNELLSFFLDDETDEMIIIWNELNEIMLATQSVEKYFSVGPDELQNKTWQSLFPIELCLEIEKHFLRSVDPYFINEIVLHDPLQNYIYFKGRIHLFRKHEETFYICRLNNITEEILLKSRLIAAEKLVLTSQLSAGLVHEIRNPLTSLKGFLQLIQAGISEKEKYCNVLLNEIEKIEDITYELLQIATPTKKEKKLEYVDELIEDVLLIMQTQSNLKNVKFEVVGNINTKIYCNATEIKQVLINLLRNASEAMEYCGTITIEVTLNSDEVQVRITDEGPGIPHKIMEKIHTPFYTTKQDGTGLGLVVSRQILQNHKGSLSVVSIEEKGCTFIMKLPSGI